ncbi:MAG: DUF123 domain-containing protein [Firmicutes bacterium]|nr:DUF123 domain-containing protein [Bacillota bacterium]MBO2519621.1 DUF123 domain-containing protein [Bacillota bacterium]
MGLPARGVYVVWLWLPHGCHLPVPPPGLWLPAGLYAYTGSAQRALPARLGRHLAGGSARHWHVDYLRAEAQVVGADVWPEAPREAECELAARLAASLPGAFRPPRFGASDCRCPGHLVGWGPKGGRVAAYEAPERLHPELRPVLRSSPRPWQERRSTR